MTNSTTNASRTVRNQRAKSKVRQLRNLRMLLNQQMNTRYQKRMYLDKLLKLRQPLRRHQHHKRRVKAQQQQQEHKAQHPNRSLNLVAHLCQPSLPQSRRELQAIPPSKLKKNQQRLKKQRMKQAKQWSRELRGSRLH